MVSEFMNSIGMTLKLIPAGDFLMGTSEADVQGYSKTDSSLTAEYFQGEQPQHRVQITKSFYMAAHETTQAQYERVMGTNPSNFSASGNGSDEVSGQDTSRFPVESISWFDAVEFSIKMSEWEGRMPCYRLTNMERWQGSIMSASIALLNGDGYRLPTEAEWEYACRAGTATPFHFGSKLNPKDANAGGDYASAATSNGPWLSRTTAVGLYPANAFGLYDMHGNVMEWCQDWFGESYYSQCGERDPQGPPNGKWRVCRGGAFSFVTFAARSTRRFGDIPGCRHYDFGCRLVLPAAGARTCNN